MIRPVFPIAGCCYCSGHGEAWTDIPTLVLGCRDAASDEPKPLETCELMVADGVSVH